MTKHKHLIMPLALFIGAVLVIITMPTQTNDIDALRKQHQNFLDNSPFRDTKKLSKEERKSQGLPPNAYNEQLWELTMDPYTGRPMPERLEQLQQDLREQRANFRGGGGDTFSPWVERGPNNVGGRTRGLMFDPNDSDFNRVFAGGVTGGLWVNEDITNSSSPWTLVPGIGANIRVTRIIYDPNDTDTFFIASGESYTSGFGVGRGVWRSEDGGVTWSNIFGGPDGTVTSGQFIDGIFYINDIIARDVGSSTELFISVAGAFYQSSSGGTNQWHSLLEQGLYKSTNNGDNWSNIALPPESNGTQPNPNDLELDIDNNVWLTTTRSNFGFDGGDIYRSTNGTDFNLITTIADARRTEIEPSSTDADTFWVAAEVDDNPSPSFVNYQADLFFTDNSFSTISQLNEPNDADMFIPSSDYTRGQAFYDLPIEVDGSDNVYVGGIDLFSSTNAGSSWSQISKWSNNNNLAALNVPLVHADHHAIVFRPGTGNENEAIFGTDGGVYYTPDITANPNNIVINNIENGYNTTQFYYADIGSDNSNDLFVGGTQDNGTLLSQNSSSGVNSFDDFFFFFSGDGSFSEIDDDGGLTGFGDGNYMVVGSTFVSYRVASPDVTDVNDAINNSYALFVASSGNFINEAELDDNLNIFYANSSNSTNGNRIARFVLGSNSAITSFLTNATLTAEPSALKVSPFTTSSTKLYVGLQNGSLLRIDDADDSPSFTAITGPGFVGSISDIEFGETEDDIFVTFHNYGVTSIWFTDDGGANWTNIEGDLPDLPVKCILQNPLLPTELIIGTELGVWRTENYTATNVEWTQSYNGMSDVLVVDLDLRTSDNKILAATHGRGLFTANFTAESLSFEELANNQDIFRITPTLSEGNFTIIGANLGKSKLNIYDLTGKLVFNSELDFNSDTDLDVNLSMNPGIYIVNLIDENNRQASQRIVIE